MGVGPVGVAEGVNVGLTDGVGVMLGVSVGPAVSVMVAVGAWLAVAGRVSVGVGVSVPVGVKVGGSVMDGVNDGVKVGSTNAVGAWRTTPELTGGEARREMMKTNAITVNTTKTRLIRLNIRAEPDPMKTPDVYGPISRTIT